MLPRCWHHCTHRHRALPNWSRTFHSLTTTHLRSVSRHPFLTSCAAAFAPPPAAARPMTSIAPPAAPPMERRRSGRNTRRVTGASEDVDMADHAAAASSSDSIAAPSAAAAAASSPPAASASPTDVLPTGMPPARHADALPSVVDDVDMQTSTQELIVSQEETTDAVLLAEEAAPLLVQSKATVVRQRSTVQKSKAPLQYDADRYHPQALVSSYWVGAHVSAAGGVSKAIENAALMGARALALDLKSKRKWQNPPLAAAQALAFKAAMAEFRMQPEQILPHGSYLMNLGSPDKDVCEKSRVNLLDELQRCRAMGLTQLNWHPGSTCGQITKETCMDRIAECINWVHGQTSDSSNSNGGVICVLENMAGQGGVIGGRFEELAYIVERVVDKRRIGVCIDTCHAFAAGYDLRTKAKFDDMMREFDRVVGLKYLRGLHLNDSKGALGCRKDRHENLGAGEIGLECFRAIMNAHSCRHLPLILETPMPLDPKQAVAKYAREVAQLYRLEQNAVEDRRTTEQKQPEYVPATEEEITEAKEKHQEKLATKAKKKKQQRNNDDDEEEHEEDACADEEEEVAKPPKAKRQSSVLKRVGSSTKRKAPTDAAAAGAAPSAPDADGEAKGAHESAPKKLKRQNSRKKQTKEEEEEAQ